MSVKWLRVHHDARTDAKLHALTDLEHRVWFNLLLYASEQQERGTIRKGRSLIAAEVGATEAELDAVLGRLSSLEIVTASSRMVRFKSFEKRQYIAPSESAAGARERKRRQRIRQRQKCDISVTSCDTCVTPRDTNCDKPLDTPPVTDASRHQKQIQNKHKNITPSGEVEKAFEKWWSAYPKKVGKGAARTAYTKAIKKSDEATLLSSLATYPFRLDEPQYIPHPSTWLNGERWSDELSSSEPDLPPLGGGDG